MYAMISFNLLMRPLEMKPTCQLFRPTLSKDVLIDGLIRSPWAPGSSFQAGNVAGAQSDHFTSRSEKGCNT